jgi:phytoene dehydrogenase-like protein
MSTEEKTVIVGAGMAGLTAAAYLARENRRVLLLEKNQRNGGLVNTFETSGFHFDSGPRAFVNSGIVKPMLSDLGIRWEFVENKISLGVEDQLLRIESLDSLRQYEQMLAYLYPEDSSSIQSIMSTIRELSEHTRVLYEFDNPNFVNLAANKKYIFRKLIPWTFKFLLALRKFNQFEQPMEEFLGRLTENQSLIDILTQHFFREMPTHFALGYFYVYLDYFYPRGGTISLVNLLAERILQWGGEIKHEKHIVEVNPAESRVTDSDGNHYDYDQLIWAADLKTLYANLNPAGLDQGTASSIEAKTKSLDESRGAESVFILFVAVDRPPVYFRENGGEHLFYTPSRAGLGEVNRESRLRLIEQFDSFTKEAVLEWLDDFCRLNTYEVSVPVLRDPSLAPEGQSGIMISFLFDFDLVAKIDSAGWYPEFKTAVEDRVIALFSETIYEGLENDVLFKFSSTPLTINQVAGSSAGAITGWSFETPIPVVSRLTDIPKSVLTAIPGVYQAGQWAYAPAGVPIAMLTGWYAAKEILKRPSR